MNSHQSVTANFTLSILSLTVGKSGTGSGTVTSSDVNISCGGTCSASYASGTIVTLTATPASDSTFTGWGGSCSGTGSCVVTMTSNVSVSATFTKIPNFNLQLYKKGNGTGGIFASNVGTYCGSGCYSYLSGTVVTLTATPDSGSIFAGWGGACSGTGKCTVTMNQNLTVTVDFEPSGGGGVEQ